MYDRLIGRLIDWLIDRCIDLLIDWSIDWSWLVKSTPPPPILHLLARVHPYVFYHFTGIWLGFHTLPDRRRTTTWPRTSNGISRQTSEPTTSTKPAIEFSCPGPMPHTQIRQLSSTAMDPSFLISKTENSPANLTAPTLRTPRKASPPYVHFSTRLCHRSNFFHSLDFPANNVSCFSGAQSNVLIYANRATEKDFEYLRENASLPVNGSIILARYGGFRGDQVSVKSCCFCF